LTALFTSLLKLSSEQAHHTEIDSQQNHLNELAAALASSFVKIF